MDNKTMVQASGEVGRNVEVTRDTTEMPVNSIENYYEFPASDTQSFETFSKRAGAVEKALGNKDSAKG